MILFSYIKHGFGNKVLIFMYLIEIFKREKADQLYIVQQKSHHEEGVEEDNLTYIFPDLKNLDWLKFVSWSDYDKLKKTEDAKEIQYELYDWLTYEYILKYKSFIKNYMKPNEVYEPLLEKYDVKKGIAIHVRYGDKLKINKSLIKRKSFPRHVLMTPDYYIKYCNEMLAEKPGPVYIFTDSEDLVKKLILPHLPGAIIADEPYQHVFFLLAKFRRQIISDSTLSCVSGYFNTYKHRIIAPYYFVHAFMDEKIPIKIIKSPYFSEDVFELDKNKKFMTFVV
jgi:hypothetical protein